MRKSRTLEWSAGIMIICCICRTKQNARRHSGSIHHFSNDTLNITSHMFIWTNSKVTTFVFKDCSDLQRIDEDNFIIQELRNKTNAE